MPGRNDPCPCGSGKKYKKCCALKPAAQKVDRQPVDLTPVISSFENGDYQSAIIHARNFISVVAHEPIAWQVLGVSLYYQGDFEEAEKAFREVIKYDKRNPDALNNLGLVLFEQNKLSEAEKYCNNALKLQPNMPGAHNNLGNIYRSQSELAWAEKNYQSAIKNGLETPEVYCNLGTVQQEQGKSGEAEKSFQYALNIDPASVAAISNLGAIFMERGELERAYEKLESAYQFDPNDTDVLCNLGKYWQEKNNPDEAEQYYLKAIQLKPDDDAVNFRIGLYYNSVMQLNEARQFCLRAIASNPDHIQSLALLGEIAHTQSKKDEAEKYFRQAIELGGDKQIDVVKSYSDYLLFRQRSSQAQALWDGLLKLYPDNVRVKLGLASFYKETSEFDKAEQLYQIASEESGADKVLLFDWANMEETRHKLDKAESLVRELLKLDPEHTGARVLLAKILVRNKAFQDALSELNKIDLEEHHTDIYLVYNFLFERAKILDKIGKYDQAFDDLIRANEIKSQKQDSPYNNKKDAGLFSAEIEVFCSDTFKNSSYQVSEKNQGEVSPIFIVGFPRSGTSLLEQILGSHSLVSAGGELAFMEDVKIQVKSLTGSKLEYPESFVDPEKPITQNIIKKAHEFYLKRVTDNKIIQPGTKFFTDKLPHNLANLGIISLVFPKASIIHITRHPMDSCLSAFMANFAHGHKYLSDIKNTVTHYALLMQAAEQYKSALDMHYLQIRYEDLVTDVEVKVNEVLDFVGLPWEEACLKFNESKRVVKTASHAQVTEKIYTSSRYRYKNYYKQLEPYAEILSEAMNKFGYTFEA